MNISGLTSNYSEYLTSSLNTTSATDKLNISADASDEQLMEACKSFESYFMEKIFDTMLESTKLFGDESSEDSYASSMVDYFKDTAIQALTEASVEQGGVGIAKQLYEQMKLQYSGINPASIKSEDEE